MTAAEGSAEHTARADAEVYDDAGTAGDAGSLTAAAAARAAADTIDLHLPDALLAALDEEATGRPAAPGPAPASASAPALVPSPTGPASAHVTASAPVPAPGEASGPADDPAHAEAPDLARGRAPASSGLPAPGSSSSSAPYPPYIPYVRRVSPVPEARDGSRLPYVPEAPRASRRFDPALLDDLAGWGPVSSRVGVFQLVPVRVDRDLALLTRWMNDPAVAVFWELAGPESVTAGHLEAQLGGDGRSMPCLGVLDGVPMSYFEIYRADLDPLARHYPARPHDTGVHLLLGGAADRGRGVGSALLRAVADHILDHRPRCTRVLAEPDLRNTPSVSAFLSGGYRFAAEVDLPDKRAALMVRDRAFRKNL